MTDHREEAERCLQGAESDQGVALIHAVLALADEVKALREAVAPPAADEPTRGLDIPTPPTPDGLPPALSTLDDDAIIRATDYPPPFDTPAIGRSCSVCGAEFDEPCRVPARAGREGLPAHAYPPPFVHRARFDGIPF